MKRIRIALLLACISVLSIAQDNTEPENLVRNSGDLENQFYFRFGYSLPTTSYLGVDDMEFWDYFSRNGGIFELGHIFMINSAALSDGLRLGINVDYAELSYHHLNDIDIDTDYALGVLKLASKIGPSLSYSPASKIVFDVFFKAKIPWVGGVAIFTDELDEVFIAKPGIGFATGINVRLAFLMLGFEFNSDCMKFESQDYPGEYLGSLSEDSDKTPMPGLSFTLGFSF